MSNTIPKTITHDRLTFRQSDDGTGVSIYLDDATTAIAFIPAEGVATMLATLGVAYQPAPAAPSEAAI